MSDKAEETRDPSRKRLKTEVRDEVRLTDLEERIFALVVEAAAGVGEDSALRGVVVRVAGGWVRDKLLGRDGDDIDLSIDRGTGVELAEAVNAALRARGEEVHRVGVIQANPDQSKHLETATFNVYGRAIDVNALRTEVYKGDSRIPVVRVGTPEEDALRRDFTLNALFFNLATRAVEDFTGRGVDDLRAGLIRTPLPAAKTFLDDPLRVLRAARFAARYGYDLCPEIVAAASSPEVHENLLTKVSKERVGVEITKAVGSADGWPSMALEFVCDWGLYDVAFRRPDLCFAPGGDPVPQDWPRETLRELHYSQALPRIKRVERHLRRRCAHLGAGQRLVALFAAFLSTWRGHTYLTPKKGRRESVASYIMRESLRRPQREAQAVDAVVEEAASVVRLYQMLLAERRAAAAEPGDAWPDDEERRKQRCLLLGRALRRLGADHWEAAVHLACVLCTDALHVDHGESDEDDSAIMEAVGIVERHVLGSGLLGCWEWRAPLDGRQIMERFGLRGPAVGRVSALLLDWRIANPLKTADDCVAWAEAQREAGTAKWSEACGQ